MYICAHFTFQLHNWQKFHNILQCHQIHNNNNAHCISIHFSPLSTQLLPCLLPDKRNIYFLYLFLGIQSEQLGDEFLLLLNSLYPSSDIKIVLVNSFTIGRLLNYEDKLLAGMRSSLVYEFSCTHCASKCVGSTMRALCHGVAEH